MPNTTVRARRADRATASQVFLARPEQLRPQGRDLHDDLLRRRPISYSNVIV
ncbi:hypothetical protein [Nocardia xishanensis]|uniref:Uncharacterized protein n=1 Tax=Nocardia xishanensis TaxID=238964 RepID=A0ABW7X4I1_9NOCA